MHCRSPSEPQRCSEFGIDDEIRATGIHDRMRWNAIDHDIDEEARQTVASVGMV